MNAPFPPVGKHRAEAPTRHATGFGFEALMARPDFTRFRRWYDAMNVLRRHPDRQAQDALSHEPVP